jgi:hypothetical protein
MTKRHVVKMVHVGEYIAEVDVELVYTDDKWSPYLSLLDALKLDDVRETLQREDVETAVKYGRVYRMLPIAM